MRPAIPSPLSIGLRMLAETRSDLGGPEGCCSVAGRDLTRAHDLSNNELDTCQPHAILTVTALIDVIDGDAALPSTKCLTGPLATGPTRAAMTAVTRRAVVSGLSAFVAMPVLAEMAWPSRPITLVIGFPAGGPVYYAHARA
jgi:hypothetical protein